MDVQDFHKLCAERAELIQEIDDIDLVIGDLALEDPIFDDEVAKYRCLLNIIDSDPNVAGLVLQTLGDAAMEAHTRLRAVDGLLGID